MKNKKKLIINLLLLSIFIFFGIKVRNNNMGILFDYSILNFFHKSTNNTLLTLSKTISTIGSAKVIIPIVIILAIYLINKKRYTDLYMLVINSGLAALINMVLKMFFNRTRPLDYFRIEYSGLSFPSGHSMTNMSVVLALLYIMNKDKNKVVNIIGYIYILLVGLSRIYLGVHWPTDVVGGFIVGYLIYDLSKNFIKKQNNSLE